MTWQMLWALILGFTLSGVVQALVSKKDMTKLLPDASPKSLAIACGLGAASSSCSYAAVALARSIFRKGTSFSTAMVFQIASTNFVIELGIILVVFMGWPFLGAELIGGLGMVVLVRILFRFLVSKELVDKARAEADKGTAGKMEGHAAMDMSVGGQGTILERAWSQKGRTAISHYFVMDVLAVYKEILIGVALSALVMVFVPKDVWTAIFLSEHPVLSRLIGPLVGPLVAIFSFVCSVGNVPLAAVMWNKGISFGGVTSFLFADLIILPILNIYRKYYGWRMAAVIFGVFYLAMALASVAVDGLFSVLGLVPDSRDAKVASLSIEWNYTTFLNLGLLIVAALLVIRFFRTGGPEMMRKMKERPGPSVGSSTSRNKPVPLLGHRAPP